MNKQISYQLVKIHQNTFAFNNNIEIDSRFTEINFNIQQNFEFINDQKKLNITLLLNLTDIRSQNLLVSLETRYDYYIPEYEELIQKNKIPVQFLAILLGISLSSTRGILFSKTAGTNLENFYLPILNPTSIIDNLVNSNVHEDLIALANIHSGLKNYEKALNIFDQVLEEDPENVVLHYNKAIIYNIMEDFEKSTKEFDVYIKCKKDFYPAYFGRAMSYFSLNKFDKAFKDLNKVLELNPNHYESYLNLGIGYLKRKNFSKALEYFELSLSKKSDNYQSYNNLADTYRKMGKLDLALENAYKSTSKNPGFNLAYATLAEIYALKDNGPLFYQNLETALQLDYDIKRYIGDKIYDKYRGTKKFKSLLKEYEIEI